MKKITETLSKEVVAVTEGEIVGIVTNAYVDRRLSRVRGYKVSLEDRDGGRLLPLRRLLGEGEAMIVRASAALSDTSLADCPMGVKVYDTIGAFQGVLRDLVYDEITGKTLSVVVDEAEIEPDRVIGFGKNALILRAPCHDGVLFRKNAKHGRTAKKPSAKPAPLPSPLTAAYAAPKSAAKPPVESAEKEIRPGEYAFLLGRTVLKTILGDKDAVAHEGDRVTPELIAKARESGKLVELTVNSRKG